MRKKNHNTLTVLTNVSTKCKPLVAATRTTHRCVFTIILNFYVPNRVNDIKNLLILLFHRFLFLDIVTRFQ